MSNGHVEIHDLFSSHHSPSSGSDPESTSDSNRMDDTVEFRLMMAFAQRRRPQQQQQQEEEAKSNAVDGPVKDSRDANGTTTPSQTPEKTEVRKKKKRKGWKRLSSILKCVKPQTEDPEPQRPPQHNANFRTLNPPADERLPVKSHEPDEAKDDDRLAKAVSRLTEIAEEIPFTPPEWETDSKDGEAEKLIGLILRESGDRLNEQELKNANIAAELFWNYSFFRELINKLLMMMGLRNPDPEALGPQASPKTQIAVTCEVTSRLSEVNSLPTNLLMRHGARYLQDYYATWAQQQGGYEAAFEEDEDEVE
ncbi:apoptosis facilitator Bcl-2-like protein 14 [Acanthochromis polyacanthus]|uniref:apoptosis facilitator Bcl-2-like protein 14 n=1 Tax=Acanthochromis polyacanthus TaxID=80966 RepID=UPI0022341950|nr:apoptosis facilitator Bcl-2-like protein 14 [Acanthochromis polyacanthus]XP_051807843.1 apoptosis facilitator Bcl-2-like protein 14 [Acanthochromis polyacanthus]